MGDSQARETAGELLSRLANLIGVNSPISSSGQPGNPGSPQLPPTPVRQATQLVGTSTSGSNLSIRTPVRAEMAQLFAPYPRRSGPSFRLAGRPAAPGRSTVQQPKDWMGRFCCLGGPEDHTTPNDQRMVILKDNGLGDGIVTTGK